MAQVQQEVWFYELNPYFTVGVFMDTSTHIEYISSNVHKLPFTISLPCQESKPKSRVVQPEFRPLYRRNTYICV